MRKHFWWYLLASLEILLYLLISFNVTKPSIIPVKSTAIFREVLLPSSMTP
ncbi:MAG: hypothetical protein U7127_14465 [Phormidium sp.]